MTNPASPHDPASETAAAVLDRIDGIRRYGESKAIGARARGNGEEERRWLDLLINVDALASLVANLPADGGAAGCECPPCPGRGTDGHGMTHCAECCFGTGVEADEDCPIHGRPADGGATLDAGEAPDIAYERGHLDGYEKGLLDPGSAWMNSPATLDAGERAAWDLRGGALWLDRHEWGVVIDALIQHRGHAEDRKAINTESTSDVRADMCADLIERINAAALASPTTEAAERERVTWTMPWEDAHDLLAWLRHNRPLGMPDRTFDGLVDALTTRLAPTTGDEGTTVTEAAVTHLNPERAAGVKRLGLMLPALASYYDPRDDQPRDTCLVCSDGECGGACQGAMEIVRQIIEALGCGDDDWDWWREDFADDGVVIPTEATAEASTGADGGGDS